MKIKMHAIASKSIAWLDDGFSAYQKRLPPHLQLNLNKIPLAQRKNNQPIDHVLNQEGKALLKLIKKDETLILLDEDGEMLSTKEFSLLIEQWMLQSTKPVMAIGGPDGFSDLVHQRADRCLSLSRLTLPHALVPVILAEQIYRAWTILEGQPYHRS